MKETLGCEKPTQEAVWVDGNDEFYNCPLRFISDDASDFLQRYDAVKNGFCRAKEYSETSSRFVEAAFYFERELVRFEKMKEPKDHGDMSAFKKKA